MRYLLLPLLFINFSGALASDAVPVFVLHSYSQEYPWTKGQHQGFIQALKADPSQTYTFNVEYLNTKRSSYTPAYADLFARYLREKYQGYRPAAIYVTNDNALSFALSHLDKVFPDAPVFFSGVNNYDIKPRLDSARITGVFEKKDIAPNLRLMRRIDDSVRDIVIVGDASETYRVIANEIREELTRYPDLHATYLSESRIDDLVALLKQRKERFVFLTTLGAVKDGAGRTLPLAETIKAVVNAGHFVVFSMEDAYLYRGVLGGYVTSGPRQGQVAAQLLRRYVSGTPISSLAPIEASPNEYILDETELAKAGLPLPKDLAEPMQLINKLPTFYETNRSIILGTLYGLTGLLLISLGGSLLLFIRKDRQMTRVNEMERRGERLGRILNTSNNEIYVFDAQTLHFVDVNYGARQNIGYSMPELRQMTPVDIKPQYNLEQFLEFIQPLREGKQDILVFETEHQRKDGTLYPVEVRLQISQKETPPVFFAIILDITERKLAEQTLREKDAHLEKIAYHDAVTGLPNRTLMMDRLAQATSRADRSGKLVAMLFIDLDRFKTINDSLGHAIGDALLRNAAQRLESVVRTSDTVSRFGGDEFMILLEDIREGKDAAIIADKVNHALAQVFEIDGYHLHVSGSIGISLYPLDGQNAETLMKNADAAMYRAKEIGRNNFHFYEQEITERVIHRMRIESKLRTAFEQEALEVFYQPIVCLESYRICGVEALLRWTDPQEGVIPPDQFIPLAEETGLIIPMGEWVIRQASLALKRWEEQGIPLDRFAMHINLSGRQLLQKTLPLQIEEIFSETGVSPDRIILELTESTIMEESTAVGQNMLTALCDVGVRIAIDDFGTGHSSLSRLKQLPICEIKIDRSFIRDINEDADDRAIIQAILALAANLKLHVVAEGVEQLNQEAFLQQRGCNFAQGYYYARPMPEKELLSLLLEEHPFPIPISSSMK